jgi:hypothetical protein
MQLHQDLDPLEVVRSDLAHAETRIAAAQGIIEDTHADSMLRQQARAEAAYYGQLATRYRSEIARLLREDA